MIIAGAQSPVFAQMTNIHLPGALGAPGEAAAAASPTLGNPASIGGVSSILTPSIGATPVLSPLSAPAAASLPTSAAFAASAVPSLPAVVPALAAAAAPVSAPAADAKTSASSLGSVRTLAERVAPVGGERAGGARAAAASRGFFDRSAAAADDEPASEAGAAPAAAPVSGEDAALGRLYPRVVVILDTLDKPAAAGDKLVTYIETLADHGVRVVFATARPEKGENSAESILISKLKNRSGNPVIVASYNGARIAALNSKAANPKPLIPDQLPFAPATVARFQEIGQDVLRNLIGSSAKLSVFGQPSLDAPYIYGGEVPAGVEPAAWARSFNRALKAAGFSYKVEIGRNAEGKATYITQSSSLKLNAGRLFNAIYAAAPDLDPEKGGAGVLKPSQVLVLGDPAKAPGFLSSLPGRGYFIHGVTGSDSVEQALGSVLGLSRFEQVAVNKYELREYLDWLERKQLYGPASATKAKAGGRSSSRWRNPNATGWHQMAFYRGIIMKETMSRLYHLMKNEAYDEASLDAAVNLLEKLWRYPEASGLHLPEELVLARQTSGFKSTQKAGLEVAKRWLKNYYHRHFPDYPRNLNEKVVGRLLRLARDGDSVTLNYASPYTGRSYKVFVRPDRTELWEDEKGYILVGHVYRTGKEPYQTQFDESVEVNLVGRALLEGDAQKRADGRWYVNGEPDPRVMVVFHYNTRDLQNVQTPAEVESHTPEVTALIEKRAADKDYQKWVADKEKENEKARANLKRTVTREANAKAKKKAAAEKR
jgi:hypothetical protein